MIPESKVEVGLLESNVVSPWPAGVHSWMIILLIKLCLWMHVCVRGRIL
jgi:hypothetical protein